MGIQLAYIWLPVICAQYVPQQSGCAVIFRTCLYSNLLFDWLFLGSGMDTYLCLTFNELFPRLLACTK